MILSHSLSFASVFAREYNYTPHLLVAGTTRSGKTTFLQALIMALALKSSPDRLGFILIAGSSDGFVPFAELPHVDDILYDADEIEQGLTAVVAEMGRRARIHQTNIRAQFDKLVIVIDEVDGVIARTEKGVYSNTAKLITRIAKEAGKYSISLILGTQKPTGDVIPSDTLSNINSRVCLQVANAKFSRQIIDAPDGAKLTGQGDLLYSNGGQITRAQGYYVSLDDMKNIVRQFSSMRKLRPLMIENATSDTLFQSQSVVDGNIYRHPAAAWMETTETNGSLTPTQKNIKITPPGKNRMETRWETETEIGNRAVSPPIEGAGNRETETYAYTPDDIIRIYERGYTMREIAKMIGRSPKYVHTVINKNRGEMSV